MTSFFYGFIFAGIVMLALYYGNPESERAACMKTVAQGVIADVKKDVD